MSSEQVVRVNHRGVEIRCGYDIASDLHRAHFELPERQGGFQRVVHTELAMAPGKYWTEDASSEQAIKKAKATIDKHLDR